MIYNININTRKERITVLNDCQRTLLELIKRSQFGVPDVIPLADDVDWNAVYDESLIQSVIGIVAAEIPEDVCQHDERWKKIRDQLLAFNIRYYYAESELRKILDVAGIPFVILKGTSAAVYYKYPERRMMGDIDFLVPQDLFDKARDILIDSGYTMEPDHQNARHIGFHKNKISYELHHHFSHNDLDIEDYLISGINERVIAKVDLVKFPMLPRLSNGLVLIDHMRNHLQSGLGLRQVIDWMMYVNREVSDEFWEREFAPVLKSIGLEKFAIVTTRMCQLYLGLPDTITWCTDADEEVCRNLLETLFTSGNFGRKMGKGNSVETVRTNMRKHGLFKWLQIAGEHNWNAYKKHHWLRPVCWVYQIFRYLRQGLNTGRSYDQLSDDMSRSKNRFELMKELGIVFEN